MIMDAEKVKISDRRHERSRLKNGEVICYARCLVRIDTDTMRFRDFPKESIKNGLSRINRYLSEERISIVEMQELLESREMTNHQFVAIVTKHDVCD